MLGLASAVSIACSIAVSGRARSWTASRLASGPFSSALAMTMSDSTPKEAKREVVVATTHRVLRVEMKGHGVVRVKGAVVEHLREELLVERLLNARLWVARDVARDVLPLEPAQQHELGVGRRRPSGGAACS